MYSLESPNRGDSNEYTQHTIINIKKENHPKLSQIQYCLQLWDFCYGLKNEFERVQNSQVFEPSVFEAQKVYCNSQHCATMLRQRNLIIQKNKQIK